MKSKKSPYVSPDVEIIMFECDDIVTSSSPGGEVTEYEPGYSWDDNVDSDW